MNYDRLDLSEIEDLYTTKKSCFSEWVNILSIPSIVVVVILLGFFGQIPIKIESHTVILISIIYIIFLFFVKHNATIAVCRFETNFDVLKLRIKEYLNDRVFRISKMIKALASMDDFFENYKKSLRNDNFSSIASSMFPTLGILGTFISIALSMPDFSSNETTAFEKEITLLLGGIATAFYVSIYGIFLSLWWIFFEKNGISKFEEDVKDLKKICNKYTWKEDELELAKFEEEQNRHKELVGAVSKFRDDDFVKDFNRALSDRMRLFEELVTTESKIFKEASLGLHETLISNQKNIFLHKELLSNQEKFSTNIDIAATTLNNLVGSINKLIDKFDYKENTLLNTIEEFSNNIKILESSFRVQKSSINSQKEELYTTLKEINLKITNFKETFLVQNREIIKSFEAFNKNLENNSKSFVKAFETPPIENIRHIYSMLLKEFESVNSKIESIPKNFDNKIDNFDKDLTGRLKNSLEIMDGELALIVEKLAIVLKSIDESSKRISNSLNR